MEVYQEQTQKYHKARVIKIGRLPKKSGTKSR